MINKLVIIGVGLIGGSLALALRAAGQVKSVVGVGRSQENLDQALQRGIVDAVTTHAAEAVADADIVLLAVPVGQMAAVMAAIAPHLPANAVVTDVGSSKAEVLASAQRYLPGHLSRFVAAHPIAGAESSGAAAASAELFRGRTVVVTPMADNDPAAVRKVREMWAACGALLKDMPPQTHDAVFAAVSHLPHLLAFALVDEIAQRPNAEELFGFAASGFRDFTRIAASSPEMWRDISLANQSALLNELDAYQAQLTRLRTALAAADGATLERMFARASQARKAWNLKE